MIPNDTPEPPNITKLTNAELREKIMECENLLYEMHPYITEAFNTLDDVICSRKPNSDLTHSDIVKSIDCFTKIIFQQSKQYDKLTMQMHELRRYLKHPTQDDESLK